MEARSCLVCALIGSIFVGATLMTVLFIEFQVTFLVALLYTLPVVITATLGGCFLCYRLSHKRRLATS